LAVEVADTAAHAFSLTEYRQFSQKFNRLKQERDQLLPPRKPA
jgi:hypothetical protein